MTAEYSNLKDVILIGDALTNLTRIADKQVDCIVTSPPYYGKRDYGMDAQLGLEATPEQYIDNLVGVFREAHRVLKPTGTLWLNLGDSYWTQKGQSGRATIEVQKQRFENGTTITPPTSQVGGGKGITAPRDGKHDIYKAKDLMMMPFRVAFALLADGWYLRQTIIWEKPACMPESIADRPTTSHEYVFLFSKSPQYYYDQEAICEPAQDWGSRKREEGKYITGNEQSLMGAAHKGLKHGDFAERGRNARSVWTIPTAKLKEAHFATMPLELAQKCVDAGCPPGGVVLDPFGGAGTSAIAAINRHAHYLLIELNPSYVGIAQKRIKQKRLEGVQLELFSKEIILANNKKF